MELVFLVYVWCTLHKKRHQDAVSTAKREKKIAFVDWMTQVENCSFTPFVMSASGEMRAEAEILHLEKFVTCTGT